MIEQLIALAMLAVAVAYGGYIAIDNVRLFLNFIDRW